jgi:hypothetical protein
MPAPRSASHVKENGLPLPNTETQHLSARMTLELPDSRITVKRMEAERCQPDSSQRLPFRYFAPDHTANAVGAQSLPSEVVCNLTTWLAINDGAIFPARDS